MARRKSLEKIKEEYLIRGFEYLDIEYTNGDAKRKTKCLKCGNIWFPVVKVVISRTGCPFCAGNQVYSIEELQNIYQKNGYVFLSDKYENVKTKYLTKCLKCNREWFARPETILINIKDGNISCTDCSKYPKRSLEYVKKAYLAKGIIFKGDSYKRAIVAYPLECVACNYQWINTFNNFLSHDQGCPECNSNNKKELQMLKDLRDILGTISITKPRIPTPFLEFRKHIVIDAAFTIKSKQVFIEMHGRQHYQPINFGQGYNQAQLDFERQQKRDAWLREYCSNNNIIFIEIDNRKLKIKDIESYLKQILSEWSLYGAV